MRGNRVYFARRGITIVAGITVTDTTGIMHPRATHECCGGVTEVAVETGRNVGGHGIHNTSRRITVVT